MRVTIAQLDAVINRINEVTKSPMEYSNINDKGKHIINIGHYHLSGAYGGWQLQRTMNNGGGVDTPLGGGFYSKRETYDKLQAFLTGIEL